MIDETWELQQILLWHIEIVSPINFCVVGCFGPPYPYIKDVESQHKPNILPPPVVNGELLCRILAQVLVPWHVARSRRTTVLELAVSNAFFNVDPRNVFAVEILLHFEFAEALVEFMPGREFFVVEEVTDSVVEALIPFLIEGFLNLLWETLGFVGIF